MAEAWKVQWKQKIKVAFGDFTVEDDKLDRCNLKLSSLYGCSIRLRMVKAIFQCQVVNPDIKDPVLLVYFVWKEVDQTVEKLKRHFINSQSRTTETNTLDQLGSLVENLIRRMVAVEQRLDSIEHRYQ